MVDKWFISDTHFFHENIIQYSGRPFKNAEFMNEYMIEEWNKIVKPQDKAYHLGDVALGFGGDDKKLGNLLSRLNGHKRLVLGNHDNAKSVALQKHFEKIEMWIGFFDKQNPKEAFTCTHVPFRLTQLRNGAFNVHGHTHNWSDIDPHYINVCVEQIDYKPISMDEILQKIRSVK